MWKALVVWLAVFGFKGVCGHGMMIEPASRNVINGGDCPFCLSAGGTWKTYGPGRYFPHARHGVCGDPHDGVKIHERPTRITRTYRQGAVITIKIKMTAVHGGYFKFSVCPRSRPTQACLDSHVLHNAADRSDKWWLGRKREGVHVMRFRLPRIRCDRCVLQWHYVTGNSCQLPRTPSQHVVGFNMCACGKSCAPPEEFWNCADVRIV